MTRSENQLKLPVGRATKSVRDRYLEIGIRIEGDRLWGALDQILPLLGQVPKCKK